MKKIISAICGALMICSAAVANETYITVHWNTPIELYVLAIELCDKNLEYDEIRPFVQSLEIAFGDKSKSQASVIITPSGLIAHCMRIHQNTEDCTNLVINAINEHNNIVSMYSSNLSSPINNRSQKVKWERWTWINVFSRMLPDNEYTFILFNSFSDALTAANGMMSLDDWNVVCSAALSELTTKQLLYDPIFNLDDPKKAKLVEIIEEYQFTCDNYVAALENIYNEQAKGLNSGLKYKYIQ